MDKLKSSFRNMVLALGGICVLSGGVLAMVGEITRGPIAVAHRNRLESALRAVLPAFDNAPSEEWRRVALAEGDSLVVYPAMSGGEWVGSAVEANSPRGFSGEIRVLVGFDDKGRIIDYRVLEHAETPGLGSQMEAWFRSEEGNRSVLGRDLSGGGLKVNKDRGEIDAIAGATISSRAFLHALERAYAAYAGRSVDASSGATDRQGDDAAREGSLE
jgi:electron transport complex protein RnfG